MPNVLWATGPGEILKHGLDLLRSDSDANRRLAMIAIDNAVELMLKTYLGLPKRINGLSIPRREFQEFSESFPALLDAIERYAADKLNGVDLGAIEWFHRLRNQLYHQGNGLTVEREKVEVYAEHANVLFQNLFGEKLVAPPTKKTELLGELLMVWGELEASLPAAVAKIPSPAERPKGVMHALRILAANGKVTDEEFYEFQELTRLRNAAVHAQTGWETELTPAVIQRIRNLADEIIRRSAAN